MISKCPFSSPTSTDTSSDADTSDADGAGDGDVKLVFLSSVGVAAAATIAALSSPVSTVSKVFGLPSRTVGKDEEGSLVALLLISDDTSRCSSITSDLLVESTSSFVLEVDVFDTFSVAFESVFLIVRKLSLPLLLLDFFFFFFFVSLVGVAAALLSLALLLLLRRSRDFERHRRNMPFRPAPSASDSISESATTFFIGLLTSSSTGCCCDTLVIC